LRFFLAQGWERKKLREQNRQKLLFDPIVR